MKDSNPNQSSRDTTRQISISWSSVGTGCKEGKGLYNRRKSKRTELSYMHALLAVATAVFAGKEKYLQLIM